MLKVAIVGCGKIADAHASQVQHLEGCEIVGVCDHEPLMARNSMSASRSNSTSAIWRRCSMKLCRTSSTSKPRRRVISILPDFAWSTVATFTLRRRK